MPLTDTIGPGSWLRGSRNLGRASQSPSSPKVRFQPRSANRERRKGYRTPPEGPAEVERPGGVAQIVGREKQREGQPRGDGAPEVSSSDMEGGEKDDPQGVPTNRLEKDVAGIPPDLAPSDLEILEAGLVVFPVPLKTVPGPGS